MSGAGKCLLWLTALATASLTLTGCQSSEARLASTKDPTATSSGRAVRDPQPRSRPSHFREPTSPATPSPAAEGFAPEKPYVLVVSDGTDEVRVAGRDVRFPGPVSDAVVSPNGMVIAYVDGLGNIATARLDGTGVRVLTSADPGVLRAQPTFEDGGSEILFSERGHDGVWRIKEVAADGHDDLTSGRTDPTLEETVSDGGHDTAPSATWYQASHEDTAHSVLVFEHRTAKGAVKVYVADRNQRGFGASELLTGRAPAVSPTGDRVAFIGAGGQIHVQRIDARPRATQVTWGLHPTGHLAWSPDGRRLFFSTGTDVESVSSRPARPGRSPAHVVLHHPGVASPGTIAKPTVGAYAGTDPVRTALEISRAHFVDGTDLPDDEGAANGIAWADHVTLLSTDDPSAAAPAAAIAAGGPVLFVRDGRLDPRVRDEILRLLQRPRGYGRGTVDVVGTTTDVAVSIVSELRAVHLRVRRFDPTDPAVAADGALVDRSSSYVVVSSTDLPGVASAATAGNPVLLTDGSTMPGPTAARLNRMWNDADAPATVYAVGREAQLAVRSSWPGKRSFTIVDVGGSDAGGDSLAALQVLYDAPGRLSVAPSDDWRSMLVAGMAGPALVVDPEQGLSPAETGWLAASQAVMRAVYVCGGSDSLPGLVGHAVYGARYVQRPAPTDIRQ